MRQYSYDRYTYAVYYTAGIFSCQDIRLAEMQSHRKYRRAPSPHFPQFFTISTQVCGILGTDERRQDGVWRYEYAKGKHQRIDPSDHRDYPIRFADWPVGLSLGSAVYLLKEFRGGEKNG
jgi:hypothetical protein